MAHLDVSVELILYRTSAANRPSCGVAHGARRLAVSADAAPRDATVPSALAESLLDASASCASGLCCVDVDGGSGPSTTASRWIHFEWRRHSREDGYFAAVALQSHDANYARGGARAVRRGGGEATLHLCGDLLVAGRHRERSGSVVRELHTCFSKYMSTRVLADGFYTHLTNACVAGGNLAAGGSFRHWPWRRAPRALALEGAQRLLRVRHAPGAPALESGRRGHVRYICYTADVRHARRLSRARGDRYASDARHARRLSRAGGVADVGHESMLASTISRARLQGSKSDMPTR